MTSKTSFKSVLTAAALILTLAAEANAETTFDTLGGIDAEPMNATEMDAVQGKAFLGLTFDGRYLHWYDDQVSGRPLASYDSSLPGVQQVIAWINGGSLPSPYAGALAASNAFHFLNQADPQAMIRADPAFSGMTSMGPCIPGWTVGC